MRYEGMYIAGVASHLPARSSVAEAVEGGLCPAEVACDSGVEQVCISAEEAAPAMAVQAASLAVRRSGDRAKRIALTAYADTYYEGHDAWLASSYVQRLVVGTRNPGISVHVRQLANGGMAALELAGGYLVGTRQDAAVVVAADRFTLPGYDRWRSHPGTVLADGAAALVLSTIGGFLQLLSVVSWSEPELEGVRRGDDAFGLGPFTTRPTVDLPALRDEFVARLGPENWQRIAERGRRSVLEYALRECELDRADIDWFVLPNFGSGVLRRDYFETLDIDPTRSTWDMWGRSVGHLGAADQFAAVEYLALSGRLRPGQHCLLLGSGADFTWSCAVVKVLDRPA